jgi:ankyrin repeat protein
MKNTKNEDGLTQLAYFASKGLIESVKKLLTCRSINLNANDAPKDETALHLAAPQFPEMCILLLENGADVDALNEDQETPLFVLCHRIQNLLDQSKDEDEFMRIKIAGFDCLRTLLKFEASVVECDVHERTVLHRLCFSNDARSYVALLLDHGADIEARNKQGWTPYFISAVFDNERVRKELERRNADVDAVDNQGRNPDEFKLVMKHRREWGAQAAKDVVRDLMRNLYEE